MGNESHLAGKEEMWEDTGRFDAARTTALVVVGSVVGCLALVLLAAALVATLARRRRRRRALQSLARYSLSDVDSPTQHSSDDQGSLTSYQSSMPSLRCASLDHFASPILTSSNGLPLTTPRLTDSDHDSFSLRSPLPSTPTLYEPTR